MKRIKNSWSEQLIDGGKIVERIKGSGLDILSLSTLLNVKMELDMVIGNVWIDTNLSHQCTDGV